MTVKFIISDTETVGLHPPPAPASGVVEVAYLELDMDTLEITNEVYSRVNPGDFHHPTCWCGWWMQTRRFYVTNQELHALVPASSTARSASMSRFTAA